MRRIRMPAHRLRPAELAAIERRMIMFDALPQVVRQAIADCPHDFSDETLRRTMIACGPDGWPPERVAAALREGPL